MTKVRRSFTDEFKREAVALLQTSGRPLIQIASELGIQPSMLRKLRNAVLRVPAGVSQRRNTQAVAPQAGTPDDPAAEIARLRREVQRLRMERDILKMYGPPPVCKRDLGFGALTACSNVSGLT
jgi:transposase